MLSIPFMNYLCDEETRPLYAAELKRAGADRVFIAPDNPYGEEPELTQIMDRLTENVAYFKAQGFEAAVWINGLGHGGPLAHDTEQRIGHYTHIIGLSNGGYAEDSFCPLDPDFAAMYRGYVRRIAETGTPFIMIDDDYRLALHGPAVIGCACPRHMKLFNETARARGLADHDYTREELAPILLTGAPTPLRGVWLELMGRTLTDFAASLRAEVDTVDSTIRLGHCACLPTWDTDGTDNIAISRAFAGNTRPYLRLIGAPYWNVNRPFGAGGLGSIADAERMQMAWCRELAPEMEIFSEGDLYPRPRSNVPGIYAEVFDQILIANGQNDGILKYMLDYTYPTDFETGYIDRHLHFAPLRKALAEAYAGKQTAGVYVFEAMHKLADMDCTGMSEIDHGCRLIPPAAVLADNVALPTSYVLNEHTPAAMVFGENAKYMPETLYGIPLILDAPAARILSEKGMDVGLAAAEPMPTPAHEHFPGIRAAFPCEAFGGFWRLTPAEGAEVLSTFDGGAPAAYFYTNAQGISYLVYGFDATRTDLRTSLTKNYPRQSQLFDALRRMAPHALPAAVVKEPSLYVLAAKDGDSMTVGLWNLSPDLAMPKVVTLDEAYASIAFIGGAEGQLEGNTVRLAPDTVIPSYGFAGFVVKK